MSITTKTGDKGYTSLLNGSRVQKYDLRVELLGELDEVSSYLGLLKSELDESKIKDEITGIQKNLSTIMASAAYGKNDKYLLAEEELNNIEKLIYEYEKKYLPKNKFIIPGKNKISSIMDICRSLVRKAERRLISVDNIYPINEINKRYLNRISDYLYAAARYADFKEDITEKVMEQLGKRDTDLTQNISLTKELNLEAAKKLLDKIENKAREISLPVVISIANQWGNTIAVHFMDGALPGSYNIAVDKAFTSSVLRMDTKKLGELAKDGQPLQGINNTNDNRIVIFGGGCPLKIDGKVVGGLGISGGSAEQDSYLAEFGADLFNNNKIRIR